MGNGGQILWMLTFQNEVELLPTRIDRAKESHQGLETNLSIAQFRPPQFGDGETCSFSNLWAPELCPLP
jgi:hypothetical protein